MNNQNNDSTNNKPDKKSKPLWNDENFHLIILFSLAWISIFFGDCSCKRTEDDFSPMKDTVVEYNDDVNNILDTVIDNGNSR